MSLGSVTVEHDGKPTPLSNGADMACQFAGATFPDALGWVMAH
ncbi:MAG TPA: hypothetical protein VF284_09825 [Rhodanobacteraceae bacterium]